MVPILITLDVATTGLFLFYRHSESYSIPLFCQGLENRRSLHDFQFNFKSLCLRPMPYRLFVALLAKLSTGSSEWRPDITITDIIPIAIMAGVFSHRPNNKWEYDRFL